MPNYRRKLVKGGTFFFTQVIYDRNDAWLCDEPALTALKNAIIKVRKKYPFTIDAMALLPDHIHCIWTLPENDSDYATRWRLIKTAVTKQCASQLNLTKKPTLSRIKRSEKNLWQRRYWEHQIRNDADFADHCNYIHFNPVKHGLCEAPKDWKYSSFHRFVAWGKYDENWGNGCFPDIPDDIGYE